ncbi:PLP-dependent aminotransferase family protein [Jannaschia aquimarina]|uniref:LysN protein n=1 Tax=Jannaschia aquimarina TaxID=935700 RepID=A0A0D1ECK0_9RHOB|nr:PLP-dependent aminotransferase family protein [Jannaschia aquimarina]KIT14656.1 2-aminoadipate transaminase [Jannaschia aquimarina]SNT37732.1 DNA-binding transcriptional regulator, MocR family, contains an aminotransferase domain [Jannaschia aquimarina]
MVTITDENVIEVEFGSDPRPKYVVLEGAVRAAIERGRLTPGTRLPPVRDLAWRVGVTPGTVARVYRSLTEEGVLEAAVGRGTFVAEPGPPAPIYQEFQALAVDATPHKTGGDNYAVNLLSPHLPSVGQTYLIRDLLAEVAQDPPSGLMHYPVHASERPAREAAAAFLQNPMLGPVEPDDIALTHGGQHGIALVLQAVLRGRRPVVLLEELAYPGFRRMAEMLRAEIATVAIDEQGIVPEAFEQAVRRSDVQILCTSPDVQNPTCAHMPEDRRRRIAAIAREADIQILEDDCYMMEKAKLPTYRLLAPERTWHVSSIAKTITPALRLGFALAPPERRLALQRAAEYNSFGLATPMSDLAAKLLVHSDLPALMEETRDVVRRYVEVAARVLEGHDLKWRPDVSFVWLNLPSGWRASAFCRAAEAAGIKIRAAEEYADRDANAPHAVRFAVNAGVSLASFEAAMIRLRDLLDHPPEGLGV